MKESIDINKLNENTENPSEVFSSLSAMCDKLIQRGKFDGKMKLTRLGEVCAQGAILPVLRKLVAIAEQEIKNDARY